MNQVRLFGRKATVIIYILHNLYTEMKNSVETCSLMLFVGWFLINCPRAKDKEYFLKQISAEVNNTMNQSEFEANAN